MNLSNLDGITIGFDYDDALALVGESTIAKVLMQPACLNA